ncbi:unnamed protein product [Lactuca virosa]|uniref:Uncharacterized protein n=1 Tax=Lactuca virosa TaxID=75947 RepID=A0AAU9MIM8_9ASTR|nr:unnamed protein product [Lactuca virosa]
MCATQTNLQPSKDDDTISAPKKIDTLVNMCDCIIRYSMKKEYLVDRLAKLKEKCDKGQPNDGSKKRKHNGEEGSREKGSRDSMKN